MSHLRLASLILAPTVPTAAGAVLLLACSSNSNINTDTDTTGKLEKTTSTTATTTVQNELCSCLWLLLAHNRAHCQLKSFSGGQIESQLLSGYLAHEMGPTKCARSIGLERPGGYRLREAGRLNWSAARRF